MTDYDFTTEINAIVKRLGPLDLDIEPDDDCDIPLPPVTPPVWLRSTDVLDNLTAKEKDYLRSTLPTEEELKIGWAKPVLAASEVERRSLVVGQIEVLRGLDDDPVGWCARALRFATEAGDDHAQ